MFSSSTWCLHVSGIWPSLLKGVFGIFLQDSFSFSNAETNKNMCLVPYYENDFSIMQNRKFRVKIQFSTPSVKSCCFLPQLGCHTPLESVNSPLSDDMTYMVHNFCSCGDQIGAIWQIKFKWDSKIWNFKREKYKMEFIIFSHMVLRYL